MISVCGNPKLVITVYGGRNYFTMDEEIEKEFMNSMAEMSITSGKLRSTLQLFFFFKIKLSISSIFSFVKTHGSLHLA